MPRNIPVPRQMRPYQQSTINMICPVCCSSTSSIASGLTAFQLFELQSLCSLLTASVDSLIAFICHRHRHRNRPDFFQILDPAWSSCLFVYQYWQRAFQGLPIATLVGRDGRPQYRPCWSGQAGHCISAHHPAANSDPPQSPLARVNPTPGSDALDLSHIINIKRPKTSMLTITFYLKHRRSTNSSFAQLIPSLSMLNNRTSSPIGLPF